MRGNFAENGVLPSRLRSSLSSHLRPRRGEREQAEDSEDSGMWGGAMVRGDGVAGHHPHASHILGKDRTVFGRHNACKFTQYLLLTFIQLTFIVVNCCHFLFAF